MGNIRQISIKNIAHELVERYPKEFVANDFQHNKAKVTKLTDIKSILLRNRIAGYVTRILSPRKKTERLVIESE